ncbi:hypothetical protein ACKWTF_004378 [Chironomus riparius]
MRENRCYKITGFKELIGVVRRQYEATLNFQEMHKNLNKNMEAPSVSNLLMEPGYDTIHYNTNHNELFSLRQKISTVTSIETRKDLRRFIITPLLNAINMGDNIDALTEMRNVVIVFANFIVPYKGSKEIFSVTNRIYKKLSEIVKAYEGVLNKILLFDKDMMFLIIFGLRGMQHENESAIGLKCAHELHQTFKTWEEIISVSIGVTSGKSYCGVVGHTLRREYSVISVSVNRAARLMMAYPNVVSCDQVSLIESKIKLRYFKQLPKRSLKGISEAISVYEFVDLEGSDTDIVDVNDEILNGRDELLEIIQKLISKAINLFNQFSNKIRAEKLCLVIKGENGEGRTRIINYLYRNFMMQDIKCIKLALNTKHSSTPFWTLKHCITKFIETEDELKSIITKKFLHLNIHKFLYLFNEIIGTNFDNNTVETDLNEAQRTEIQKQLIAILCKSLKNFWIILIDDADYIDLYSLKFINSIIMSQTVFVILAIGKNHKKWTLQHGKFIKNEHVTQYNLKPIDKTFQKDIACQSLNVSAIPIEFERFIHKNSNGNAGWIEACSKTLLYSGKLKIKTLLYLQAINDGMIMRNELNHDKNDFFDIPSPLNDSRQDNIVINVAVIEGVLCEKDYIVGYKNNKLMVYDTLSSYDQMICKCASVIGPKFYRQQLDYLITKIDYRHVGKTILKLFQLNILFCASLPNDEKETNNCVCKNVEIFESCRDLPKYSNCAYLTFNDESFRNYVYDTLTEKQRIEYHRKCIHYLCRKTTKCESCNRQRFEIIDEIKFSFYDGIVKKDCKKSEMREKVLKAVLPSITNRCNDISRRQQSIVLNFMNYEYRNCKCKFLLHHAFNDVVRHCQGRDLITKKIFSQIVSADLSIKTGNIPNAMHSLDLTLELLNDESIFHKDNFMFTTYLRGRAYGLKGRCLESIGENERAIEWYCHACSVFKISFPKKFNFMAKIKQYQLIAKIKYKLNHSHEPKLTRLQLMIINECSLLLQNLFNFFTKTKQTKLATLAAVWALKDALKTKHKIVSLVTCFTNFLNCKANACIKSFDMKIFSELFDSILCQNIDKECIEKIVELYTAVMEHQIYRRNIKFAIKIGKFAKKMCYNLGNNEALLKVIPSLFILYMKSFCIEDCYKLLQELHYSIKFNSNDENAKIWFYALCMDLYLDTRHDCVVDYDECKNIYIEAISIQSIEMNIEAYLRFIINFNLWNARKGWKDELQLLVIPIIEKSFAHDSLNFNQIFTGMRLLELLHIHMSQNDENFIRIKELCEVIELRMEKLKISW